MSKTKTPARWRHELEQQVDALHHENVRLSMMLEIATEFTVGEYAVRPALASVAQGQPNRWRVVQIRPIGWWDIYEAENLTLDEALNFAADKARLAETPPMSQDGQETPQINACGQGEVSESESIDRAKAQAHSYQVGGGL